jgi:hypothetical protein
MFFRALLFSKRFVAQFFDQFVENGWLGSAVFFNSHAEPETGFLDPERMFAFISASEGKKNVGRMKVPRVKKIGPRLTSLRAWLAKKMRQSSKQIFASSSSGQGQGLLNVATSTWTSAVASVANVFTSNSSSSVALQKEASIYNQLERSARSPGVVREVLSSLSAAQQQQLAADINASQFQFRLIDKSPNVEIAKLLYNIGVHYDSPRLYAAVLHHTALINTQMQLQLGAFNWAHPKTAFYAIRQHRLALIAIDEWLNWLVYDLKIDPFGFNAPPGDEKRPLFFITPKLAWKTPAFYASMPPAEGTPYDVFHPGFIWFVRHFGNFPAYQLQTGEVGGALDQFLDGRDLQLATTAVALFALCPEHLSMDMLPANLLAANKLVACNEQIINRGGSADALLRVPNGPGLNDKAYGDIALQNGNVSFLNECQSVFGAPPIFSDSIVGFKSDILPWVRIDLVPWLISFMDSNIKLDEMIQRLPWQYAQLFRKYFYRELDARPSRRYI